MITFGLFVRWAHLAASMLVVGAFAMTLLAGAPRWPTARAWQASVLMRARALLLMAIVFGLASLGWQTAVLEGRASAALDPAALLRVLLETQAGHVWLARHGLLILLAAWVALVPERDDETDWLAARGQATLLGVAALVLLGAAGHAAAVEPGTFGALVVEGVHLLAASIWVGALLPLAALLRCAMTEAGADSRPYAVVAARRLSRTALLAVVVLAATGAANAWTFVGSVGGLLGTPYGRLLLLKLSVLAPILALAIANRRRLLPALSGDAVRVGRPALRMLAGFVTIEAVLALALLAVVAAMGVTAPARHEQPTWPLPFRLTLAAIDGTGARLPVLIGSQVVVLGLVGLAIAALVSAGRRLIVVVALALLVTGLALAVPPLAVDAYPTTYRRSDVPYSATSIAHGADLFRSDCAGCHGSTGAGDGRDARGLPRPPADLRSPHTGQHTAGDLYWWITAGIPGASMPGFGQRLGDEERWDLVNFVRALGSAEAAKALGTRIEPDRPWLVAPDFSFTVGPMPARSLRDYRGRNVVLVLYTLPASRPRIERLAAAYEFLNSLGSELIAVPRDSAPDAIRQLAGDVRMFFPIVTGGAEDIVTTYSLFTRAPHAEFVIDRQGYLRARWAVAGTPERDIDLLLADLHQLNQEKVAVAPADEHVH